MQFNGASGQKGPTKFDLNVVPAWIQGYTGKGVVVSVVDEGVYLPVHLPSYQFAKLLILFSLCTEGLAV